MAKNEMRKPPPKCKAILLCDHVLIDAVSNKVSVIGIFEQFGARGFPNPSALCMAFIQLTDGEGAYQCRPRRAVSRTGCSSGVPAQMNTAYNQ